MFHTRTNAYSLNSTMVRYCEPGYNLDTHPDYWSTMLPELHQFRTEYKATVSVLDRHGIDNRCAWNVMDDCFNYWTGDPLTKRRVFQWNEIVPKHLFPADLCEWRVNTVFEDILHKIRSSPDPSAEIIRSLKFLAESGLNHNFPAHRFFCSLRRLIPADNVRLLVSALCTLGVQTSSLMWHFNCDLPPFEDILRVAQECRLNVFRAWGMASTEWQAVDFCMRAYPEKFLIFLKYGARCVYNKDASQMMRSVFRHNFGMIFEPDQDDPVKFRCYQMVWFHSYDVLSGRDGNLEMRSLKHEAAIQLWNSIPDPYLTEREFMNFENTRFAEAWRFYNNVVLRGAVSGPRTPRSLLHLSKCVIRQELADNFQCPKGIQHLKLPELLKRYLSSLDE